MAHSIQLMGGRSIIVDDILLLSILRNMILTARAFPAGFAQIDHLVRDWEQSLRGYGPGVLDLRLEVLKNSPDEAAAVMHLLELVKDEIDSSPEKGLRSNFLDFDLRGIMPVDNLARQVSETVERLATFIRVNVDSSGA